MPKKKDWLEFVRDNNKRTNIAFGIAVMAIGYNLLPIVPPAAIAYIAGIFVMLLGAIVVIKAP